MLELFFRDGMTIAPSQETGADTNVVKESAMITLTDTARAAIEGLIAELGSERSGLRISIEHGGCSGLQYGMALEEVATDEDLVLDWGAARLFLDRASLPMLQGATIDFAETVAGKGFSFQNPNAEGKCSCGKSFSA